MRFTRLFALASIQVAISALGADIDILLADAKALFNGATAFESGVSAFPTTIGLGTLAAVRNLEAPLSEVDGLRVVAALDPVAQIHTRALQALQARRDAIAALPSLGPISAINAILQALGLVKKTADTGRAALITYAFTGAAIDAWNDLVDDAIAQLDNTINFFSIP
ncbi:hypothetical protein DXG01_010409 [Tephrocybe rancida]|nr:hypothetical protein DXG01_010409 [Tephrocybe rancida]